MWHVYRIVRSRTDETVYVGMTADIDTRMQAHGKTGPVAELAAREGLEPGDFRCIVAGSFDKRSAAACLERRLIGEYPQALNKVTGGGGRARIEERHETLTAQKPWAAAGMSRASWYRRQKERPRD